MPLEPDVEREFRRVERDMERMEQRLTTEIADVQRELAELRAEIRAALVEVNRRLDAHIEDVRVKFEQRARERHQEQMTALDVRKSDRRWQIGTALVSAGLIVSAIALLFNAIGGT